MAGEQAVPAPMREPHELAAALMDFDLDAEAEALVQERPYLERDRNAKTLVKSGDFRLVLVALRSGATFDESDERGSVAIETRRGTVVLTAGGRSVELQPGRIAVIGPAQPWTATAREDSIVVLRLTWPSEPGSRSGA